MAYARLTDPQTSHEAAGSVRNVSETHAAIMKIYQTTGPLTDPELTIQYNKLVLAGLAPRASESGIRSRRSELVDMDLVKDTGHKDKLPSGRYAIIWGLV